MIIAAKGTTATSAGVSRWIIGGNSGALYTSDDGIPSTWTNRTSGFGTNAINSVASSTQIFVAVGAAGVLTTSTDAITWTARTSSFGTTQIRSVGYGNGVWVAVGDGGKIATATDPTGTWTQRTSGTTEDFTGIAYGAGIWVAVHRNASTGQHAIRTATDPTSTWTSRTTPLGVVNTSTVNNVKWCPNQALFITGSDDANPAIATSADGITWTGRNLATALTNGAFAVYTSNSSVIAVGLPTSVSASDIDTSTDGVTWTARTPAWTNPVYGAATDPGGLMVIAGWTTTTTYRLQSSTDGVTWTSRTAPSVAAPRAVCHTQGF